MKQKTLYTCEVCHTDYAERLAAERCEKNHKQKLKIKESRYLPFSQDKSGLPVSITIETPEGEKAVYKR